MRGFLRLFTKPEAGTPLRADIDRQRAFKVPADARLIEFGDWLLMYTDQDQVNLRRRVIARLYS